MSAEAIRDPDKGWQTVSASTGPRSDRVGQGVAAASAHYRRVSFSLRATPTGGGAPDAGSEFGQSEPHLWGIRAAFFDMALASWPVSSRSTEAFQTQQPKSHKLHVSPKLVWA
jgi:hypothetical protein